MSVSLSVRHVIKFDDTDRTWSVPASLVHEDDKGAEGLTYVIEQRNKLLGLLPEEDKLCDEDDAPAEPNKKKRRQVHNNLELEQVDVQLPEGFGTIAVRSVDKVSQDLQVLLEADCLHKLFGWIKHKRLAFDDPSRPYVKSGKYAKNRQPLQHDDDDEDDEACKGMGKCVVQFSLWLLAQAFCFCRAVSAMDGASSAAAAPADAGAAPQPTPGLVPEADTAAAEPSTTTTTSKAASVVGPDGFSSYMQSCMEAMEGLNGDLNSMSAKPWFWYSGTLVLDVTEYEEVAWTEEEMLGSPWGFTARQTALFDRARGFYHPGDLHANGARIWKNYAKSVYIWHSKKHSAFYCSEKVVLDSCPDMAWEGVKIFCSFQTGDFPGAMGPEMTGGIFVPWWNKEVSQVVQLRNGDGWYKWMGELKMTQMKRKLDEAEAELESLKKQKMLSPNQWLEEGASAEKASPAPAAEKASSSGDVPNVPAPGASSAAEAGQDAAYNDSSAHWASWTDWDNWTPPVPEK
ncbi:unnamed protein product, partial [Symbiodinium sp. CCMP2456]